MDQSTKKIWEVDLFLLYLITVDIILYCHENKFCENVSKIFFIFVRHQLYLFSLCLHESFVGPNGVV